MLVIARLQQIHLVVDDIGTQAKQAATIYEVSLDIFSPNFEKLIGQYQREYDRYRLDEIVVAAIAPVVCDCLRGDDIPFDCSSQVRRILAHWQPLEEPDALVSSFRGWRDALKMAKPEEPPSHQVQVYGSSTVVSSAPAMYVPFTLFLLTPPLTHLVERNP